MTLAALSNFFHSRVEETISSSLRVGNCFLNFSSICEANYRKKITKKALDEGHERPKRRTLTKFCKKCYSKTFVLIHYWISVKWFHEDLFIALFSGFCHSVAVYISITCFFVFFCYVAGYNLYVRICIVILYPCSCVTTIVGLCGLEVLTRFIAYGVYFV